MGEMLLTAKSAKPGSSELVLVSGDTATGYRLLQPNLGAIDWQKVYSGVRGTQGARLAGAEAGNRQVSMLLEAVGTSTDDLIAKLNVLKVLDDEWRRFGGSFTWRPKGGTFKLYGRVLDSSYRAADLDLKFVKHHRLAVELAPVCAPYLEAEPMDIFDGFDTDTTANYAKDADAAGLVVKGGQLVPAATGTSRWRHTGRGYAYGDVEATLKITTGSTVASIAIDVFVNADTSGAETFFSAQLAGGNLNVAKWVAGVNTWPATTAFALSANTTYWLRVRREGRRIRASVYTSEPTALAVPAATASYVLTILEKLQFAAGNAGFRIASVSTGERYDDFRVEPFTYGTYASDPGGGALPAPDERAMRPKVPGDGPPLADIQVTQSGGSAIPLWGMLGWWERPSVWNYLWNGDFEDDADGWSVAAVAGVTGAATSNARSTTAGRTKYGGANMQIVNPATANTGATFKINRRFYQGRNYYAFAWVSSTSGTTLVRIRLGVSGDIADSAAAALTTTPTLRAAVWNPSADHDGAYVAAEITAATATTWNIDAILVVEGREATLAADAANTDVVISLTSVPDDWPRAPFLAHLVGTAEILRVASIDYVAKALTVARSQEGTTASGTALAGNGIIPLPPIRSHYEGKGAQPPVGIIEAESDDPGNRYTWALSASAQARLGNELIVGSLGAAGSVASDWLVDPHLLVPDDYTQGELAIEVWGRIGVHTSLTTPTAILSLAPETATVSSGVLTSNFGAIRYTEEFGSAGKLLTKPSSGIGYRFYRLGTITFPVDLAHPLRSRLQLRITWAGASSGSVACDYLVLVPLHQRAASPSLRVNDANFPKFIASTAETQKTVRSDLSGLVAKPPLPPHPDHGLGGALIELPPGNVDWMLKLSNLVPDDPTSDATAEVAESPAGCVHLAVTPRFLLGRSE